MTPKKPSSAASATASEAEAEDQSVIDSSDIDSDQSDDALSEILALMRDQRKRSARRMKRYDRSIHTLQSRVSQLEEQISVMVEAIKEKDLSSSAVITKKKKEAGNPVVIPFEEEIIRAVVERKDQEVPEEKVAPIGTSINTRSRQFSTPPSRDAVEVIMSDVEDPGIRLEHVRFNSLLLTTALKVFLGLRSGSHRTCLNRGWIMSRPFEALVELGDLAKKRLKTFPTIVSTVLTQQPDFTKVEPVDILSLENWRTILDRTGMSCCESCTREIANESPTATHTNKLFALFISFIEEYIMRTILPFRNRTAEMIRFDDLCYLFHPGDDIAVLQGKRSSYALALRVLRTHGGRQHVLSRLPSRLADSSALRHTTRPVAFSSFFIDGFNLDFNGHSLTPVRQRFIIESYEGERPISDLRIFPIEYSLQPTRAELIERGSRFMDIAVFHPGLYMTCKGQDLTGEAIDGEVVVDMQEYLRVNPDQVPTFNPPKKMGLAEVNDYMEIEAMLQEEARRLARKEALFTDEDFMLCHYRLHAFKLSSRTWIKVHIDTLRTVSADSSGFDLLVLPPEHKKILISQLGSIRKRSLDSAMSGMNIDFVEGKGQGLIILLHGAPGVGKTSTAECIARLILKPLYPITFGALGTTYEEIESRLTFHLALASKWNCVVLLDEADLFLSRRNRSEFKRNSIVVTFLRALDYYSGVIVMTTNRVGTLDEAVQSRVHISLYYPEFTRRTVLRVFKKLIDQTEHRLKQAGRIDIQLDAHSIIHFAKSYFRKKSNNTNWNGRQIRNAFQAAIALAEWDHSNRGQEGTICVRSQEFYTVAATIQDFDQYMTKLHGGDLARRAMKEMLRTAWEPSQRDEEGRLQLHQVNRTSGKHQKKRWAATHSSTSSSTSTLESESESEPESHRAMKTLAVSHPTTNHTESNFPGYPPPATCVADEATRPQSI